jgi:hypothetical protein
MHAKSITVEKRTKIARASNCVGFIPSKLKKAEGGNKNVLRKLPDLRSERVNCSKFGYAN